MIAPPDALDRIMAVMECAFPPEYGEAWNRRQVGDALVLPATAWGFVGPEGEIGADPQGEAAGFFLSRTILDEVELLLFAVAPQWRGRGLGDRLLTRFITDARAGGARRVFLEMRRNNPAASLYARHGFTPVGIRPRYYRTANGERLDAISQELVLR